MVRLAPLLAVLVAVVIAAPAQGATLLRLDGIGPVELGMSRLAALDTGWLGDRDTGCPLGGRPFPITYRFTGPRAPAGIEGSAEFRQGTLAVMSFERGVRTRNGVVPGTTSVAGMLRRYRRSGFRASARYVSTFQGTFVTVRRQGGAQVIGGFAPANRPVQLVGIPFVPVCE
jgi:hypothetical protein